MRFRHPFFWLGEGVFVLITVSTTITASTMNTASTVTTKYPVDFIHSSKYVSANSDSQLAETVTSEALKSEVAAASAAMLRDLSI